MNEILEVDKEEFIKSMQEQSGIPLNFPVLVEEALNNILDPIPH